VSTLVFLPAWNEAENLPAVLDELKLVLPEVDVLVVDDGSTDGTADVARARGAEVVSFSENRGLPAGIAAGYAYALKHDYDLCGRVVAVGSRFASGEGFAPYRYTPSGPRRFGTALLRRAMRIVLRRPFLDATSGMYAANAKALPVLAQPYATEAPEVEALLRLNEAGLRVDEVPVEMRERAGGESKLRGVKSILVVVTVIGTLFTFLRRRR
jgi:hypothetical protein